MTPSISLEEWLRFIRQEYLESFVRDGGAAIKFAVPLEEDHRAGVCQKIIRCGEELGYLTASVNAEDTKVHLMDHLFFSIAQQVPWQQLSQRVLLKLARMEGYAQPYEGDSSLHLRLAQANQEDPDFLRGELRRHIEHHVLRQRRLSRDFRVAMTHLCRAELTGGSDGVTTGQVVTDWLTGRNRHVAAVKPYQIFNGINRANARHLFESLLHWVRFAGYPGLLLVLDAARIMAPRNPRDDKVYYNTAAVLDAYEVLREFIDATDRLVGCLLIVVSNLDFLNDDRRGIGRYEALKFRVWDEIRDSKLVNPMSGLVRVTAGGNGDAM